MSIPDSPRAPLGNTQNLTREYIAQQLSRHPGIVRDLYERALNSLEYLAQLRECGFDPILKGGSAVQLLVPDSLQRLSIDLDFATTLKAPEIVSFIEHANKTFGQGKTRYDRVGTDLPPHLLLYNVYIPSIVGAAQSKIELDFLLHEPHYKVQRIQIRTFFYQSEITVLVPTVEALFGDKLTVLADGTIGKELARSGLSYAKQCFDLQALIAVVNNTKDILDAVVDVFEFEKQSRHLSDLPFNKVLESINRTAQLLSLVNQKPAWITDAGTLGAIQILRKGIEGLSQYTSAPLRLTSSRAGVLGSKLAFLCSLFEVFEQKQLPSLPPFSIFRDDNPRVQQIVQDSDQLDQFIQDFREKKGTLCFVPISLKKINPVALVYWHAAYFPSKTIDLIS